MTDCKGLTQCSIQSNIGLDWIRNSVTSRGRGLFHCDVKMY